MSRYGEVGHVQSVTGIPLWHIEHAGDSRFEMKGAAWCQNEDCARDPGLSDTQLPPRVLK